jgi:hypothetical protein
VLLPLFEWLLNPSPLSFCNSDWLISFKPFDMIKKPLLAGHFNAHLHHTIKMEVEKLHYTTQCKNP